MRLLPPLIPPNGNRTVLLGMSGGTDSSVAAMLLQDAGYEVTGVTFRFYEAKESEKPSYFEAQELAARLNIDHIVYDAREEFETMIIRYFVDEYMNARTPVPCVVCNNRLKWPLLLKIAKERGIFYISTGHYARRINHKGLPLIAKGTDPDKDQSFFLWGIAEEIRKRMLLPLGEMLKSDVRKIAQEKGFIKIAEKKDSIGVCFCPDDYRPFLLSRLAGQEIKPGFFTDEKGDIIAKHKGYPFYTIGQRRGLGINLQQPVYVKEINKATNRIVLSGLHGLYKQEMVLADYFFADSEGLESGREAICKIRYRKQATPAIVKKRDDKYLHVQLLEPLEMVAPGQAAAFYDGNFVIGGGIIDSAQ